MNSFTWTLLSSPHQPAVSAQVNNGLWQTNITATTMDSKLTVIGNSFIKLLCVASYPIFWYRSSQEVSNIQFFNCFEQAAFK